MLSNGAQFGIGLAIAFSVGHIYLPALMRKRPAIKRERARLERLGASGVEVR